MDRWPESTAEVQLDSPKSEQNGLEDIGRDLEDQVVLILVGLPGSSKSTFSNALVNHSQSSTWSTSSRHAKHTESLEPERTSRKRRLWSRVSQDEAPNRRRQECEAALREALYRGENVIVDRVNFDPSQRAHFISIAEHHTPKPLIWALILDVSLKTLHSRLEARPSHPTIPDAETGHRVLNQMKATWSPPFPSRPEGFDRVYTLPAEGQPVDRHWGAEEMKGLLLEIEQRGERETGERARLEQGGVGYGNRGRGGYGEHRGQGRGRGDWMGGYGRGGMGYRPRRDDGQYGQPGYIPYGGNNPYAAPRTNGYGQYQYEARPSQPFVAQPSPPWTPPQASTRPYDSRPQ